MTKLGWKARGLAPTLTALCALLASCGGGGGSSSPAGPPATVFSALLVAPTTARVCLADSGNTVLLEATPHDQSGQAMNGLSGTSFTSSDVGIATVASNGVVRAIAAGTARITASLTAAGTTRTGSASITVATAVAGDVSGTVLDDDPLPHIVVISAAQLSAGTALSLNIKGQAFHSHTLDLTSTQVRMIAAGCRVVQTSSTDTHSSGSGAHAHTVSFN